MDRRYDFCLENLIIPKMFAGPSLKSPANTKKSSTQLGVYKRLNCKKDAGK
jgi:hypothetical protein